MRDFDKTLEAIVSEGQKKAVDNGEKRILTASKVTTIASMVKHIENNARIDAGDVVNTDIIVPRGTSVSFIIEDVNRKGEIIGKFEFEGEIFKGVLQNVSPFNRNQYRKDSTPVDVVVRNLKNGRYTLLEKYKLQEIKRN